MRHKLKGLFPRTFHSNLKPQTKDNLDPKDDAEANLCTFHFFPFYS